jgi:hypothetical protein
MAPDSEIDVMKKIETLLNGLSDSATQARVLHWTFSKFGVTIPSSSLGGRVPRKRASGGAKRRQSSKKANQKNRPSIIKVLNLKPKGKPSFRDFAASKAPAADQEKCAVSVHYLEHELGITDISINHIYTCYKDVSSWRVPDIYNVVSLASSRKGWLDTQDMNSIKLTPAGENLVEFDLPRSKKAP